MEAISCGEAINISKHDNKICVDCKTSKTPLWRSGPAGPKSLCNACGIRYRKKKNHIGVLDHNNKEKKHPPPPPQQSPSPSSSSSTTTATYTINRGDDCGGVMRNKDLKKKLRIKLVALGKEVVLLQGRRSPMKKVKRRRIQIQNEYNKLGEVEQAAFLLMSLSYGSVFA